jgi:hypothetical protein
MCSNRLAAAALVLMLAATPATAEEERGESPQEPQAQARPNALTVQLGGQIRIAQYRSFLKLAATYARWLTGDLWLDFGAGVTVEREANISINGGVRWVYVNNAPGVRAYLRGDLEMTFFLYAQTRLVIGVRGAAGVGWFFSPTFGLTAEGGLAFGPAVGGGVDMAAAVDLLIGAAFLF